MNIYWNNRHGRIFTELIKNFHKAGIRYFILRNYEGLPNQNTSKDVDIIIDPMKIRRANDIIVEIYRQHGFTHHYLVRFSWVYCWHAMDIINHQSIHIDLIAGYRMKGYEVFTFDELYAQTIEYKNFRVLNRYYEGLMVFIYKQFGYKNPILKQEYKDIISYIYKTYPEFEKDLYKIIGRDVSAKIIEAIRIGNFDKMLGYTNVLSSRLKRYSFKKAPFGVSVRWILFYWFKFQRIMLCKSCYIKSFSVMAPDGAGKTTFLNALLDEIDFYFTKETGYGHVYHFRPTILPNLGAIGEKAGMMKQDKNFTTPHRAKPANKISSFIRLVYYWMDYVIGWHLITPSDIQFDRFTIFDRYAYDIIVDPGRTRLNLPKWVRKIFVHLMPEPNISFYINVEPNEIYRRKQELELDEITRQVTEYKKLAASHKRIIILDGNRPVEEIVKDAIIILLNKFTFKN